MAKIGVLFDIDDLGSGLYGLAAYRIFFGAVNPRQLTGCILRDGDTNDTLHGSANHYCIAVESLDAEKINSVRAALSASEAKGLLPLPKRFIDEAAVSGEPLVVAGRIDPSGNLVGCQTGWITNAFKEALDKHS
jgi:hypothetical protein